MKKFTLFALMSTFLGVFAAKAQFTESFDVAGTPANWTVINNDGDHTWEFGPLPEEQLTHSGAGAAFISWDTENHDDYLITPQFTVTAGVSDQIRFFSRNHLWFGNNGFSDAFNLVLSTTTNDIEAFDVTIEAAIVPPLNWTEYYYDLSAYEGQQVYIAFQAISSSQDRLYLDDVYVEPLPTCPKPTNVTADLINGTSVNISWTENGGATKWIIKYGETGFDPQTAGSTVIDYDGNPGKMLSGLNASTTYDFYVRAACTDEDLSEFSNVGSFYTGYCQFTSLSIGRYINNFSTQNGIVNISNLNSGDSPNGYGDFTNMAVSSYASGSFDFNAEFFFNGYMTYAFRIWIDFNNNLTFDASEIVYDSGDYVQDATGTITIPAGTPDGNYRMRIVADNINNPPLPCGGSNNGEAEDYTVTVANAPGCLPVTGMTVESVDAESADVSWTPGGDETEWEVLYGETGFDPTSGGTPLSDNDGTPGITISGLDANTTYDFYVTAICGADEESSLNGPVSFTTNCSFTTVPYTMNFESAVVPGLPACTSVENAGLGNEWKTVNQTSNGFYSTVLLYGYNNAAAANAWFYTQGVQLTGGTNYMISYKYGNNDQNYVERMKVAYGTSPQVSQMTTPLANYPNIGGATPSTSVVNFIPESDGVYYFGFNAYSAMNQFNLFLDDININEGSACVAVTGVTVSNIIDTDATIHWTQSITANVGYQVLVFLEGADPTTDTPLITETVAAGMDSVVVSGLAPETAYDVYVVSDCGAGGDKLGAVVTFTTATTGVRNNTYTEINYFPNPVEDQLTITAGSSIENVTVYSLIGKAVMQVQSTGLNLTLDMSKLPAGTYIVQARVAEGVSTFKIVKQ